MRFSTALSVALFSFAKLIVADSEQFGLLTIRSGSALQYAGVYSKDGALYFGSGDSLSGVITDDGKLKFTDNTYAVVGDDGYLSASSDESAASTGFSIKSGYLAYADKDGFYGVLEDSSYKVATKSENSNSLPVAISARGSDGQVVPDFSADGSETLETTLKDSSVQPAAAVSQIGDGQIQATTKTTAEAVSQIGDGQIQATTKTTAEAVSQIGDGQIQATTKTTAEAVSQIGDGQIQATTKTNAQAVSQIGDGQIQATTSTQSVLIKTESGNNAGKVTFGAGAGIAAIAALLL